MLRAGREHGDAHEEMILVARHEVARNGHLSVGTYKCQDQYEYRALSDKGVPGGCDPKGLNSLNSLLETKLRGNLGGVFMVTIHWYMACTHMCMHNKYACACIANVLQYRCLT